MNQAEKRSFDSVILAGGFGKRLAPLTNGIPKPLLPINNESAYLRNLRLLRACGFKVTAVTTMYLPEMIEAVEFEDGDIGYFRETVPLGSAGAVAQLKGRTEDCILVLSGDAICDFDLKKAKDEFLESGCDGAILLSRAKDTGEYGTVCVENGRVTQLLEKPSARDTVSNLISTGIYFLSKRALELIPDNEMYDFAKDLFPAMMRNGMPIAAIEPQGKWFDIGSFGDYHQCNMWVSMGENCIGKQVSIHPDARIDKAVIFDKCTIGNSTLRGCILAEGVVIGNDCIIPHGCIIGAGAEIRNGVALAPGSIVSPGETIKGEALIECFPKPRQHLVLDDDYILADDGDEGYFVHLGRLLGGEGKVMAFAEGGGTTLQLACELSCGAAKAGSSCTMVSGGNSALAAFAAMEYSCRTAFIAQAGGHTEVRLFSPNGMAFSREELRALSAKKPITAKICGSVYLLPHGALIKKYLAHVRKHAKIPKSLKAGTGHNNKLLREVCEELGVANRGDISFNLAADGEKAYTLTADGREISFWQLITLCCIEGGRTEIVLPRDTPNTVERILNRHSVTTRFYGDSNSPERKEAEGEFLHRDGIILALTAAAIAEEKGIDMEQLSQRIPPFSVMTRVIYADKDRMYGVISKLKEASGGTRNAGFDFGDGRVSVFASAAGRFRLVAEAIDSETAEEISLKAIDMLNKE